MLLLRIVAGYWIMTQLIGVLALAPWLSTSAKYRIQFEEPVRLNPTWFTFFQLASAFSNNGMRFVVVFVSRRSSLAHPFALCSLIDTSMIPFGTAYWLIIVMSILILAGNTAFPVFLRLTMYVASRYGFAQARTEFRSTTQLDHLQTGPSHFSYAGNASVPARSPPPLLHLPLPVSVRRSGFGQCLAELTQSLAVKPGSSSLRLYA